MQNMMWLPHPGEKLVYILRWSKICSIIFLYNTVHLCKVTFLYIKDFVQLLINPYSLCIISLYEVLITCLFIVFNYVTTALIMPFFLNIYSRINLLFNWYKENANKWLYLLMILQVLYDNKLCMLILNSHAL